MRFADSIHQTIAAKVPETGYILRTIITTVSPIPTTIGIYFTERLIYPIPDTTALHYRFCFENIHVFLQSASAIAHSMQIFSHDERTIYFRFCLAGIGQQFFHTAVHTAVDIRIIILFGTLVLYRAGGFNGLHPIICSFKIDSVTRFVAQRPDHDTRMVLGTFVHTLRTVHVCRQPSAILCQ